MKSATAWIAGAFCVIAAVGLLVGGYGWRADPDRPRTDVTARRIVHDAHDALTELRRGNDRFVHSARILSTDTGHDADVRHQTAREQHPLAAILCCSDSRVCPEFIFDQPAGSFFEVRNAGNVVDEDVLASCEYSVEHLHVPLLLVMGHKGCGAIEAVYNAHGKPLHDHLIELQKHMSGIEADVAAAEQVGSPELLVRLSEKNAKEQAKSLLRDSQVLKSAVEAGRCQILYGLYDMETGLVDLHTLK
jgi:carbonic anhydrase